ncbi:MAG: enoyl-ACP reductase FabV [Culicoidibacterales bacterium]
MLIKPLIKMNVAMNAHPKGCFQNVEKQIQDVKSEPPFQGPKTALIIGGSTGYGLATRIALTYGSHTETVNVSYEAAPTNVRTGSAGYWNNAYFNARANQDGILAKDFIGDAFSDEMKQNVISYYKEKGQKIDLVVYSLASGRRTDPRSGTTYTSGLKVIGEPLTGFSVDIGSKQLVEKTVDIATEKDIEGTIKVMGGEDWQLWLEALNKADLLSSNVQTVAYTYIGPEATRRIYREGTIGKAKEHLEQTAHTLTNYLTPLSGKAYVASLKAVVTRASAVIPIFPVYGSVLFKVMKEFGNHESTHMHVHRFVHDMLYGDKMEKDAEGRVRPDSWELSTEIQNRVETILESITPENFTAQSDVNAFVEEFMQLNGFDIDGVDYDEDIDLEALQNQYPL